MPGHAAVRPTTSFPTNKTLSLKLTLLHGLRRGMPRHVTAYVAACLGCTLFDFVVALPAICLGSSGDRPRNVSAASMVCRGQRNKNVKHVHPQRSHGSFHGKKHGTCLIGSNMYNCILWYRHGLPPWPYHGPSWHRHIVSWKYMSWQCNAHGRPLPLVTVALPSIILWHIWAYAVSMSGGSTMALTWRSFRHMPPQHVP